MLQRGLWDTPKLLLYIPPCFFLFPLGEKIPFKKEITCSPLAGFLIQQERDSVNNQPLGTDAFLHHAYFKVGKTPPCKL